MNFSSRAASSLTTILSFQATDAPGLQYSYPLADYATRNQIYDAHKLYTQGILYFLSTDSRVWPAFRAQMNTFGLCKDEVSKLREVRPT